MLIEKLQTSREKDLLPPATVAFNKGLKESMELAAQGKEKEATQAFQSAISTSIALIQD